MAGLQHRLRMLLWSFVVAALAGVSVAESEYFAVCDAGSTGTRLYIFELDIGNAKAKSVFVKKTKPGLSSYVDNPSAAVPALLKLFNEGVEKVPEERRSTTSLTIFGTAGMRLLSDDQQTAVWKAVRDGLLGNAPTVSRRTFPFSSLEARTVSGDEEGLWALLTANFLASRMSHDLLSHGGPASPMGLMDLGGSSTQIAIPSGGAAEKGALFTKDAVVHSYLGFGMTYLRERVRQRNKAKESPFIAADDAVCYFHGSPIEGSEWNGSGNATKCREVVREMVKAQSHSCLRQERFTKKPCLGDLAKNPAVVESITKGKVNFFAVAGMTYVVDFVRWWLETWGDGIGMDFLKAYPQPSLDELTDAVNAMCGGSYAPLVARSADKKLAHPFTGDDNLPYRCFQANYILVLLGETYGFARDGRTVTFALDVEGEDLEWPLGALLHQRAQQESTGTAFKPARKEL